MYGMVLTKRELSKMVSMILVWQHNCLKCYRNYAAIAACDTFEKVKRSIHKMQLSFGKFLKRMLNQLCLTKSVI